MAASLSVVPPGASRPLAIPLDASETLASLVVLSLRTLLEILSLPLPESPDRRHEIHKLQLAAAECVLRVQTRVDRNCLRKRELDVLPRLLQMIEEERA